MGTVVRIGVIGPGSIADVHLAPALARTPGALLWSVLSRDAGRAAAFAERHGARAPQPAHNDLDAFLADPDLDAVLIASPDRLHAPQAIAAARAGKHILVEKPMATSTEEAEAMVAAARGAGVVLAVAYHLRWHAGHRALAAKVHAGELGEPLHVRAGWSWPAKNDANWRAHGEVGRWWPLAGVGTHCVDLARWLLRTCGEVVEVRGLTSRPRFRGSHEETALVGLRFESGATAELLCSVLFASPRRVELYTANATAICDETLGPHGAGAITIDGQPLAFERVDPYEGEVADFVRAIRIGEPPEVDGAEGARNVAILEAVS